MYVWKNMLWFEKLIHAAYLCSKFSNLPISIIWENETYKSSILQISS